MLVLSGEVEAEDSPMLPRVVESGVCLGTLEVFVLEPLKINNEIGHVCQP